MPVWLDNAYSRHMELGHWVTGSSFWPGVRPEFFRFSKKYPKYKTHIWNAEIAEVIVRCLLLDWNHWMSVHAMNFYFYLWLLKILWPENTSSHISRHLEFIIEQGYRVNWVSGSLGHKMWPSSICDSRPQKLGFWAIAPQNGEQYQRKPQKAHPCASPRSLSHQAWKSVDGSDL